jgi:hypothetical protein
VRLPPAIAVAAVALLSGCGSDSLPQSGDPEAVRMLAFAGHGRELSDRTAQAGVALLHEGADARETRRYLVRLGGEAVRLREDVERGTEMGSPARAEVIRAAREDLAAARFLGVYTSRRAAARLRLAAGHLRSANGALRGAEAELRAGVGAAHAGALERLTRPAPALR